MVISLLEWRQCILPLPSEMELRRMLVPGRIPLLTTYKYAITGACVVVTLYVLCHFQFDNSKTNPSEKPTKMPEIFATTIESNKPIYLHSFPWFYEFKMGNNPFKACPTSKCSYTDKPETMEESDVIIFYTHGHHATSPPRKVRDQVWVFFAVESPVYSRNSEFGRLEWEGKFNWTMSYRFDSDMKFGYGDVLKGGFVIKKDYKAITMKKRKLVAWFVSNCATHSQRMKYVRLLQKYVPVDIYGHCSHSKCGKENDAGCLKMLENDYKFYLSFENSLCDDYFTEKVLRTLKLDIVPIVRGGANYSDVFPSKMVINTADFASVNDLARYILYLDNDIDEYVSYFKWKDSYHVVEPHPFPHCELCERVHHPSKWTNSYKNVVDWWSHERCHEAKDLIGNLV